MLSSVRNYQPFIGVKSFCIQSFVSLVLSGLQTFVSGQLVFKVLLQHFKQA